MQGLRSEYQAGSDHLIRRVHVQSAYYEHERCRNPVHTYRGSLVRVCGLRREEEADFQHMNPSSCSPASPVYCFVISSATPAVLLSRLSLFALLSVGALSAFFPLVPFFQQTPSYRPLEPIHLFVPRCVLVLHCFRASACLPHKPLSPSLPFPFSCT